METKNRSDSVDSRSYSFDSNDSKYKITIKKVIKNDENENKTLTLLLSHPNLT
mgnify:CR=1 FL=1